MCVCARDAAGIQVRPPLTSLQGEEKRGETLEVSDDRVTHISCFSSFSHTYTHTGIRGCVIHEIGSE